MKINGRDIYFDVDIQTYVEIREYVKFDTYEKRDKEFLEVKTVSKEHIKRQLAEQLIRDIGDELKAMKAYSEQLKSLFLTAIESAKLVFEPYRPKVWYEGGYLCVNLFRPSSLWQFGIENRKIAEKEKRLYKNGDISFLSKYQHIQALLNNLLKNDYVRLNYFINWLSAALVTLQKNGTAIVFKGVQGTGKGVLYEQIIQPIIGEKYTYTFSNHDLKSNFNKNLQNKLFVVGNEIKGDFREGNNIYETLKIWVTDKDLRIEIKGKDAFQVTNYFNLLLFSNNETPLQIQASDRRYTVFETNNKKLIDIAVNDFGYKSSKKFIEGIRKELFDFVRDLFKYDFDILKARVPLLTPEKIKIYIASVKKSEIFADAVRNNDIEFFENTVAEYVELMNFDAFYKICKVSKLENKVIKVEEIDDNGYPIQKVDKESTYRIFLNNFLKQLETGIIENSLLTFMFLVATGENPDSTQKIGTALTSFFGKSKPSRVKGKLVRCRFIEKFTDFPF